MTILEMLGLVVQMDASDLHLLSDVTPMLRIHGQLVPVPDASPVPADQMEGYLAELLSPEQRELLHVNKETDFSYQLGEFGRFRINLYFEKGKLAGAFRLIPTRIKTIEELGLPSIVRDFTTLKQGLVLVTGPTGHGKSSTIAAILDEINRTRAEHILTIEDPIEFIYGSGQSIVSQRELHADTHAWEIALRSALREDPNVVLVGEMRDFETIAAALTVAETGHLVFATLHTNSASQTIDRVIDVFPAAQQAQVRSQLSLVLQAVFSQRLVPSTSGGRAVVAEVLIATPAVRNLVREGKTFQLDNVIQTSAEFGMMTLEASLSARVAEGLITPETAREYANRLEGLVGV